MDSNQRIAINTIILYGRLIITTILGLFASRIILNALGVSEYGLYSVVGGIVVFMNVLGTTMVSTSYRFIAVELGKGHDGNPQKVYSTVLFAHIILALLLIIIGETLGLYYVNNYLVSDDGNLADARFVLHMSLLTTALTVVNVPANGLTIAKENFFLTSIIEITVAILKIGLVLWIAVYLGNRLRMFSIIMFGLTAITFILYQSYSWINYKKIVSFKFNKERSDYKSILNFTSWSLLGASAYIGNTQGSAMIINHFFGTVLNAAFGIATQVNRYTNEFVKSISQAAVPQIMKSYGEENNNRSLNLVYVISRLSSLALLIVFVPLLICTKEILTIWLSTPPEYSVIFVFFLLINTYFSVLGAGFDACIQSTGKIKINEIGYSIVYLSQLPIIFCLYKIGLPPYFNVLLLPVGTICVRTFQLFLMKKLTAFDIAYYCKATLWPVLKTTIVALLPAFLIKLIIPSTVTAILIFIFSTIIWTIAIVYLFGINSSEKKRIIELIKKKIIRK